VTPKVLTIIQSVWASAIGAIGFVLSLHHPLGFAFMALAVIYGVAILSWHRFERWAWWFCFLLAASLNLLFAPDFIARLSRLVTNDPVTWNSPETKIVVTFEAVLIVIPATLVILLLVKFRHRRSA
jgi:hypothetical protein